MFLLRQEHLSERYFSSFDDGLSDACSLDVCALARLWTASSATPYLSITCESLATETVNGPENGDSEMAVES